LFTVGLGSHPRTEGLGGRPGGGGGEERGSVWVSGGIRAQGVARLSLRGRPELSPPCVRNYQVITDDLHLKEGLLRGRSSVFIGLGLVCFAAFITHFLPLSFPYPTVLSSELSFGKLGTTMLD